MNVRGRCTALCSRMALFRSSFALRLTEPVRFLHRSAVLFARGVRRSDEALPASVLTKMDKRQVMNDDDDDTPSVSIQEEFARLELQRLEQQSTTTQGEESFVDEETERSLESENVTDESDLRRPSIDPSTTSVILFPGQGTQFVGMG